MQQLLKRVALWALPLTLICFAGRASAEIGTEQRARTDAVVIHTIGGPICANGQVVFTNARGDARTWQEFFRTEEGKGTNYIIDRTGNVAVSTPEDRIAYHALSYNTHSIGIELVNRGDGREVFPPAQIASLVTLLRRMVNQYHLGRGQLVTHAAIDNRSFKCGAGEYKLKQDPGALFPMDQVLSQIFR
jgi:N-acetylmuramoyl-L-alanine amidase